MFQSQLIIGGEAGAPEGAPVFERRGPGSGAVVTRAAAAGAPEAERAAASAARAFVGWSETAPERRAEILTEAAGLMRARAAEAVAIAADETGAAESWTRFNIDIAEQMLRQAATLPAHIRTEDLEGAPPGERFVLRRRPAGVVLAIAPWNAPVTLATRAVAAPLACGNTVVLKASELCPMTHEWVARVLIDAGLPEGALNFVTNAPDHAEEVVSALIAHPAVRRVNFTGSTRVGREIAVAAARHLKPCLLELSGKGTLIVRADADLALAARAAAHGAFANQGQVCMSTERILVDDRVADAFLDLLAAETERLQAEHPENGRLGALVSPGATARLMALVEDAIARGARLVTGGGGLDTMLQPTVIDRVAPGMRLYAEEAFGPIVGVTRVGDDDEAQALANDTEFGLVASVFSRDTARAEAMLAAIDTGLGHVNRSTVHDHPALPFGGVKASGYGRFGGLEAIREFTEIQAMTTTAPEEGAAQPT
ncbi:aldehyde dehydrogenase family protein [Histidinibacterium aquaticum]|uniref:Aldehyde dehydrogenase family protein n=1 Tax=Histidinibacterium aquaticum TaxID=2613962 RepID=A0A5J5GIB7_9RHOB|nr:aldehyde dehydrogenase family protein [Histidinibacterium aquaticum]KAA9007867.1 aldehyde dehydrogenase family protein [Histidinibacterium aquaticum]